MELSTLTRPSVRHQLESFSRSGYITFGPLLSPEEVSSLRLEYDRVMRETAANDLAASASNGEHTDAQGAPKQMLQILQMCEKSLLFRRLLYDPRILEVVTALIGNDVMLFHDQALYKPPFTGGEVHWHQDNGYWGCRPANLVSCWLTLDDADIDNGAMQVVPGSHGSLLPHGQHGSTQQQTLSSIPHPSTVVVVDLPAGGCMFHHCQTLHYTASNRTARPRRAFAIHYMPTGTRNGNGEIMPVSWSRPLVSAVIA